MPRDSTITPYPELDLSRVRVGPLGERRSLSRLDEILVDPAGPPPALDATVAGQVADAAAAIRAARARGAGVMLLYGAHLVKNGAAPLVQGLLAGDWLTHLATNGAGIIHDWEFAWLGRSTESVRAGIAAGNFGTWDETGRFIHLAVLTGALRGEGFGQSLGRFIVEGGVSLPAPRELEDAIRDAPADPLTPARAELLQVMRRQHLPGGPVGVEHHWQAASIVAAACRRGVPLTVHPGIGYDIITNHPWFNGAALGRAAATDFRVFARSVDALDGGVVLSVGTAVMGPQVFEKSISCVNNLRLQAGRPIVQGHQVFVVDLQDGGGWDWRQGEPPKSSPAYYLRFCKSFARVGGTMHYVQADNVAFLHHLLCRLRQP